MKLTDEEIKEIADRMDDLMWEGFHDIVYDVYHLREYSGIEVTPPGFYDCEIWDEDIIRVRKELKKHL